jgi:hypothetical protein
MMGLRVVMDGLTFGVCPLGLRVGMLRLFGAFCRDFFIPWESVSISRMTILFYPVAKLEFGNPVVGTLSIPAHVADRLARSAGKNWPEPGPFLEEDSHDSLRWRVIDWMLPGGGGFLILTALVLTPSAATPVMFPILITGSVFAVAVMAILLSKKN